VAAERPEAILKQYIDPAWGWSRSGAEDCIQLGLKAEQINPAVKFLTGLYRAFLDTDASLLEINPFISCTTAVCSRSTPS